MERHEIYNYVPQAELGYIGQFDISPYFKEQLDYDKLPHSVMIITCSKEYRDYIVSNYFDSTLLYTTRIKISEVEVRGVTIYWAVEYEDTDFDLPESYFMEYYK